MRDDGREVCVLPDVLVDVLDDVPDNVGTTLMLSNLLDLFI